MHITRVGTQNTQGHTGSPGCMLTLAALFLQALQLALKCADIGSLAESHLVMLKWAHCLEEEFFAQGDIERAKVLGAYASMQLALDLVREATLLPIRATGHGHLSIDGQVSGTAAVAGTCPSSSSLHYCSPYGHFSLQNQARRAVSADSWLDAGLHSARHALLPDPWACSACARSKSQPGFYQVGYVHACCCSAQLEPPTCVLLVCTYLCAALRCSLSASPFSVSAQQPALPPMGASPHQ